MRILPREEKFYNLFLNQVDIISEASRLLLQGVKAGNARLAEVAKGAKLPELNASCVRPSPPDTLWKTWLTS